MVTDLMKLINPEILITLMRSNPELVLSTLQKFDAFVAFGAALNPQQQMLVSKNLSKVADFFKSEPGKAAIGVLVDEFKQYVK